MKYLKWNNAIINHYFNEENEEKEVILYFSERIIEEIGKNNFEEPEDGYISDFYKALKIGVPGLPSDCNYIQRILELERKYNNRTKAIDGIPLNYPPYFTYFIAFILPFTSGDTIEGLNSNNFYDYVNTFFKEKGLISSNYIINSNKFKEIDNFWEKINYWLIEQNNFQLGYLEDIHPPKTRKYVGKFAYYILFRKEQEEKLSTIFVKEDILPNEPLSEKDIKDLLTKYCRDLKISETTNQQIKNEDYFGKLIINRALKYYNNWDGTNYDNSASKGYSRAHLAMCLTFNRITKKIELNHYRIHSNKGIPENSVLKYNEEKITDVKLVSEKYSNPIPIDVNIEKKVELIDEANQVKYTFKPGDFYIFKKRPGLNEWIQIPKVEYNAGTTLVIAKKEFQENKLKHWFEKIDDGNKKLFDNNEKSGLPDGWLAFTVNTITSYPHPEILDLSPKKEDKPKINFDRSFYVNGNFFADKLPLVWVENLDSDKNICAVFEDETIIPLPRKYEDQPLFTFTNAHIERKNEKFKLVCDDIESSRFYHIVDFKKKSNNEIEGYLPIRNEFGQIIKETNTNYLKGIEPFLEKSKISNYKSNQKFLDNKFISGKKANNFTSKINYNPLHKGNILINYISTKGKLSKKDFDKAVFSLIDNLKNEDIQKTANYLRYSLQDAGFIDYDAQNGKIVINKPHLLVKPSDCGIITFLTGARDNDMITQIINYCQQYNIYIEVQDDTDELHPQIIYLKFKTTDISIVESFATHFNLIFKKGGLYTQFAMASFFPDISKWNEVIEKNENEISDFPGGLIFDIDKLAFIPKPDTFDKNLSFIKYTNINGYKTIYRLWYDGNAHKIEEQQLGIYLYLYLYKKMAEDNYNNCVETKGWINCGEEQEKMDRAKKKTNIILYDKNKKYLAVPLNCRLPRNLSISIALLNGQKPEIKFLKGENINEGMYILYKNVPSLFLSNTIRFKLLKQNLQSINETEINIAL